MIDSGYMKTLEAGVQMAWMQQDLHLQNLSNIETPGYKSKSLVFDEELKKRLKNKSNITMEDLPDRLTATVATDENSLLPDGNNVDIDKESVELYKAYVQYSLLMDQVKSEYTKLGTVLSSSFK